MKNIRSLALSLSLLAPVAVFGQTHGGSSQAQTGNKSDHTTSSASQVRAVNKDSLDAQVTAKNLLGKDVHDQSGKKIGSIEDVLLADHAPTLVAAFSQSNTTRSSGSGGAFSSSRSSTGDAGVSSASQGSGSAATSGSIVGSGNTSGTPGTSTGALANTSSAGGGSSSDRYTNTIGTTAGSGSAATSGREIQVVISTGGFAGMGRNYVQLPISQLSYNSSERHFVAAISQSQLQQASASNNR